MTYSSHRTLGMHPIAAAHATYAPNLLSKLELERVERL